MIPLFNPAVWFPGAFPTKSLSHGGKDIILTASNGEKKKKEVEAI